MAIDEEDVARVRAATDFVGLASEHIALKREGRRWKGLCPFHAEKSPSFSVNAEEGLYHCFGCGAKGDVITFVREIEHLDFVEAVEMLAARAGIELRYDEANAQDRNRSRKLYEAMEAAVEWYHQRLLTSPDASGARAYLRGRGYDGEVVRKFRLGWAPEDWDALCRGLRVPDDVLVDTGLGFLNRRGRRQDAFRGRVMFPIFDAAGRAVAFGGRVLPEAAASGPKYKNSADGPIYSKRRVLYGLNWAKADVVAAGQVVVCEGYTDVIGFFLAGVPRAVATCGTSLADEHFRLLKNFARTVVLAYDADAAGRSATERFHEWERRFEMDIAVAALPEGADPADVARTDPESLRSAVESALPFLGFRVERILRAGDLRTGEGRARTAQTALAVVAEHPDSLVRDQYVMQVADRCRVGSAMLREMLPGLLRRAAQRPDQREARGPRSNSGVAAPELAALRLAVLRPDEVADRLDEALFLDPVHRAAFRALASATTLHQALAEAEPEAGELLSRLAVEEPEDDADHVTSQLAWIAGSRVVAQQEAEARADGAIEGIRLLSPDLAWVKLTMQSLHEPEERVDATRRLVAWLAGRGEGER